MRRLLSNDHQVLKLQKMHKVEETIAVWTHPAKQNNKVNFQIIREEPLYWFHQTTISQMRHQPINQEH